MAANASTGLWAVTGGGTGSVRTVVAGTGNKAGISVTNGDGVSGNPTVGVDIVGQTTDSSPDTAADYVMTYDASDTANKKVLISLLGGKIAPDFHAEGKTSEGVDAGSAVAGNNGSRDISTVYRNALSWTVTATTVTLPVGTYYVEWGAPGYKVNAHRSTCGRASGGTLSMTNDNGRAAQSGSADSTMTWSEGAAVATVSVSPVLMYVGQYCQTARATDGLGLASPGTFGTGDGEHFAWIKIWKL